MNLFVEFPFLHSESIESLPICCTYECKMTGWHFKFILKNWNEFKMSMRWQRLRLRKSRRSMISSRSSLSAAATDARRIHLNRPAIQMAVRVMHLSQHLKVPQKPKARILPQPKQKHLERVFTVSIQKSLKNYVFARGVPQDPVLDVVYYRTDVVQREVVVSYTVPSSYRVRSVPPHPPFVFRRMGLGFMV